MKKTITFDGHEITLSNNIGWLITFRDQFGHDIVPVLVPALNAGIDLVFGVYKATGGDVSLAAIMNMDTDALRDAIIDASGIESVELLNVIWAMAKNADDGISEPRKWFAQFDTFPLDIIAPAVFELIYTGFLSGKNSNRLRELIANLKPESTSTNS